MKNIIIYGPTAVGKSDVAVLLAKKIDAEIISCDSIQIYKDLNIGTAKITKQEMQGIPHHLIDIKECTENYSAFEFVQDCKRCITDIKSRGKNVIIVGGTGLYIKALHENYNYAETQKDDSLRAEFQKLSTSELVQKLQSLGQTIKQDDLNNRYRLIRYIEIALSGSKSTKSYDDNYIIFGLTSPREVLYQRINNRVDAMIKNGLLQETQNLLNKLNDKAQNLKAIAYKELIPYLKGEQTLEVATNNLKQRSRNYAKRQITFMNQFKNIIKINVNTKQEAFCQIYNIIKENTND